MSENTTTVEYVDPCPGMKGDDEITETCGKCSGSGEVNYGRQFHATVDAKGRFAGSRRTCYDCNGTGKHVRKVKNLRAAEHRRVNEQNKAIAKAAQAKVAIDAWAAQHPALAARLAAISDECYGNGTGMSDAAIEQAYAAEKRYGDFIVSLAHQTTFRPLTEAQTTAAAKALAEFDARVEADAAKANAARHYGTKGEKVAATGTVVVSINVDGYAYGATDRMVIVEGTGDFEGVTFKATGSGATLFATERGDSVKFTATIKDHREYKGIPQTVITRAKMEVLTNA